MIDTAKFRALLESRKAELQSRMTEIDDMLDASQSKDWEELATERESDEVLERMGAEGKAEMAKIEAALDRMEEGEFGYCVKCGNEISTERLELLPHTPFCRTCASQLG